MSFQVVVGDSGGMRVSRTVGWQVTSPTDTLAPVLASFEPASGATGVALSVPVVLRFSEPVVATSVTNRLQLMAVGGPVQSLSSPVISSGGADLTYAPLAPLPGGTQFRVTLASGVLDPAGNALATDVAWTFTTLNPGVPIAQLVSPAPDPTNTSPIPVTASFSLPVSGFDQADLAVVNGTITNFTEVVASQVWTFGLVPSAQGLVQVTLPAGAAFSNAGVGNAGPVTLSRTFSTVAPIAQLLSAAGDPTNQSPIPVTASFSTVVIGFDQADLGVVNGSIVNFLETVPGQVWTFGINPGGPGTVQVTLAAGVASSPAGNGNLAAAPLARVFDNVTPSVSLLSAAPEPTGVSPIPVTASFSEAVTGFDQADLVPGNGTVGNFVTVTPGLLYTFDLTPIAVGAVSVFIPAGVASDAAGNGNLGPVTLSRTFSSAAPLAQLLTSAPEPTNASPIPMTASFSKVVVGFDASDVAITNGSLYAFTEVTPGQVWTFNVVPDTQGPIQVSLAAGVATDTLGNGNLAAAPLTRTFDSVQPAVEFLSAAPEPTGVTPIPVTASFSETVAGFDAGDLVPVNGTITNFVAVTPGRVYTFDLSPVGVGTVQVSLAAGVASDAAGNGNLAATTFSRTFSTPAPIAQLLSSASEPTNLAAIPAVASFSKVVIGFTSTDLVVSNGSLSGFTETTPGQVWTFDVLPAAAGSVTVALPAGVASDTTGNGNLAAGLLARSYDPSAPAAQLLSGASDPTRLALISVTASFSEVVTGFDLADLTPVNGTVSNLVQVTPGRAWTFDLAPSTPGSVQVTLTAGSVSDLAGNTGPAAVSLARTYDPASPIAELLSAAPDPFSTASFSVTASFSEPVTGFDLADLTPANATVANLSMVTPGQVWTFDVVPTSPGLVEVTLAASAGFDIAGNGNTGPISLARTFDPGLPTLLLTTATSPTNLSLALVVASFSEPVNGFSLASVSVSNGSLGALTPLTASISWQFEVLPAAHGEVVVTVASGAANDLTGYPSRPASLTFLYDIQGPVAQILSPASEPTNLAQIPFTASFSEDLAGLTTSDFSVSYGILDSVTAASGTQRWNLLVTPSGDGSVTVTLGAYQVYDLAGNGNPAATSEFRSSDRTSPSVYLVGVGGGPIPVKQPVPISIESSEPVTGFTQSDLTCTNATIQDFVEQVPGASWTATVVPTAAGQFDVTIQAGAAFDRADNGNPTAGPFSWIYDDASPTSELLTGESDPTPGPRFDVTASFSEDVTGLSEGSLLVDNGFVYGITPVSNREYTVTIEPSLPGLVTVELPANVASDASDRGNLAAPSPVALTFAPNRTIDTLAGIDYQASATADGTGADARFITPFDVVADGSGNRYVSDYDGHVIRKIALTGETTILAGTGVPGSATGASTTAQFRYPAGLALNGTTLYVADSGNNVIRQVSTSDGTVSPFVPGGTLNQPMGLSYDSMSNTLYIADTGNHCIRTYFNSSLDLYAGTSGSAGFVDGTPGIARLSSPRGIHFAYPENILYVADTGNHAIRTVTGGTLSTFSGAGTRGFLDGTALTSLYDTPTDVLYAGTYVWVTDSGNHCIRQLDASGNPTALGGTDAALHPGWATGSIGVFRLNTPTGLTYSTYEGAYLVCDQGNHRLAGLSGSYDLYHIAGVIPFADGSNLVARFNNPGGTAVDPSGYIYVADTDNHCIRMIDPSGNVSTVAGKPGQSGFGNNAPLFSLFFRPTGLVYNENYAEGPHLLVADTGNNVIRKVDLGANVSTVAGVPSIIPGYSEGAAGSALFNAPTDLASDSLGNIFVADSGNHVIRKLDVSSSYQTSLFAGAPGTPGAVDGTGGGARFTRPTGLTIDPADNLFVADTGNGKIRQITPAAEVSTVLDLPAAPPTGIEAFPNTSGLLVTASSTQTIRQGAQDGSVAVVVAGGATGFYDNYLGTNATFRGPEAITVGADGYFYIADRNNHAIRRGRHDAPMP